MCAPAADGADVGCLGLEGGRQGGLVDLGVVGQKHDVGSPVYLQMGKGLVGPFHQHLVGLRKTLSAGELGPWIDHHHGEPQHLGKTRQRDSHMHPPNDHQQRWRQERLDIDLDTGHDLLDRASLSPFGEHRLGVRPDRRPEIRDP